ncbi:MAG: helix-turn-helix transcriptional regulator [Bacteroidia bacterium]|nr:helix-turn-helix transcriptional regulator [Bacteroidia bacterium]
MTQQEKYALYIAIGLKIKEIRQAKGMNQESFARSLNLTRASIANIEQGRQRATIHLIYDICKKTEVNITDILPVIQKGDELLAMWQKRIEIAAKGDSNDTKKLKDFLIEITSECQK